MVRGAPDSSTTYSGIRPSRTAFLQAGSALLVVSRRTVSQGIRGLGLSVPGSAALGT